MNESILFIAPSFFNYHNIIIAELNRRGYEVTYLADRPFKNSFLKLISKYLPFLIYKYVEIQNYRIINTKNKFDIILVINGQTLSQNYYNKLYKHSPAARKILYIWDSISNRKHILTTLSFFQRILSFDPLDCLKYNFQYSPLFYPNLENKSRSENILYDFAFIGTMHSDRMVVLNKIFKELNQFRIFKYLYIQSRFVFYIRKFFQGSYAKSKISDFNFESIDYSSLLDILQASSTIIDIEHTSQTGLTIRSIEALGMNKKLITTNSDIVNYDFYNKSNILVVDRNNILIPNDFIKSKYVIPSKNILMKYSIESWLNRILF